jgi:hypothetical protein
LDVKQAEAFAWLTTEQAIAISETRETIMTTLETALTLQTYMRETRQPTDSPPSSNVRSIIKAASRKKDNKGERDIDTIIWPLLNNGMTVRAIVERANTSTATVGRSC